MHHLINKDAKKMLPVSSAAVLDWGSLLIPLGLFQSGICARERKPQPEVMQGSRSIPETLQNLKEFVFPNIPFLCRQPCGEHSVWKCQKNISAETGASTNPWISTEYEEIISTIGSGLHSSDHAPVSVPGNGHFSNSILVFFSFLHG